MPLNCKDYGFPPWYSSSSQFQFSYLSGMIHMIYFVPCGQYHFGLGIFVQLHPSSDGNSADSFQSCAPGVDSGQSSSKYSSKQGYFFLTYYPDFIKSKLLWVSYHKAQVVAMC